MALSGAGAAKGAQMGGQMGGGWGALIGGIVGGIFGGDGGVEAQTILNKAAHYADVKKHEGEKEMGAAALSLKGYAASLNNQRKAKVTGDQINALAVNTAKSNDQYARTRLQAEVADAERNGAIAAMSAAAGVGGSSLETVKNTASLHSAINREIAIGNKEALEQNQAVARDALTAQMYQGQDVLNLTAAIDYGVAPRMEVIKPAFLQAALGTAPELDWKGIRDYYDQAGRSRNSTSNSTMGIDLSSSSEDVWQSDDAWGEYMSEEDWSSYSSSS